MHILNHEEAKADGRKWIWSLTGVQRFQIPGLHARVKIGLKMHHKRRRAHLSRCTTGADL